ncbi:toll-like receptor 21 [Nothobranchius furzeri]|uniref:Toll-like receptor 13 n=1 Tax=Nothobranchius furzeri TaxID=105023 RepID=A0A8C6KN17_NOTFU|nr:toll-like receptor 21 [Nothobranchius furzeri]KAF7227054.1 toll-like receptor 13 [Nothobranchius furzeri]
MEFATRQMWLLTFVLAGVNLISGYSFQYCVADPSSNWTGFRCCENRIVKNLSVTLTSDLPKSAISLLVNFRNMSWMLNNSLAHLPNLQNLRLDENKLSRIDPLAFQNLHQLKSLNLSRNNLSKLSPLVFENLHNLTFLSLSYNKLKEFPDGIFSGVPNLSALHLRENSLKGFSDIVKSVAHLKNLTTLDLCSNQLTSLSHSNASLPRSLNVLYLCNNNLRTLGCKSSFFKFIEVLDLSNNNLLPTEAFQGLNLSHVNSLRLNSTRVKIVEFLNASNIYAGHVDFSGTRLNKNSRITQLCEKLQRKLNTIKKFLLSYNGIKTVRHLNLSHCPEMTGVLDLSHNDLKTIKDLSFLGNQTHITTFIAEHNHLSSLPDSKKDAVQFESLEELSYRYNRILSVDRGAFQQMPNLKSLKLNINNLAFLHQQALKGLRQLQTLRLDNNLLTDLFNVTFEDNVSLQVLNLRNNRISVIFNGTFFNLRNLTTLDLGGNKISYFQPSGFDGLTRLSNLYLDLNNLKKIDLSHQVFKHTLTVLDLSSNNIRFLKDETISPFANLSRLRDLKLSGQRNYGLTILPRTLFRGLRSLESLYLTDNQISHLFPDAFDDLTALRFMTLDNCCVGVTQLQPGVFKNLRNLTRLVLENMGIQNISKGVFGNLTQLRVLQLNHNVMQNIPTDALESLPSLQYLDIRDIPLSCTCRNSLLQDYTVNNPDVQVVHLYALKCQQNKMIHFYNFDTKVCYIDLGKYLFLSTAAAIFLFTVTPLFYVKLYWKIKYSYYVFRSWFGERWNRLRENEENCKYDAFISYNFSDEEWVMRQLLPNLEGNGSGLKLCLHHRDFELGRNIVDNIVAAVYSSRKTVCVVSRSFLQSEWCSLEIQLASYRLFDEHRDVLLLVFLEPVSERQLSSYHRMRKVMLKKTYLQWPGSDGTSPPQAQELFWNQLRRAIKAGSKVETEDNRSEDFAPVSKNVNI